MNEGARQANEQAHRMSERLFQEMVLKLLQEISHNTQPRAVIEQKTVEVAASAMTFLLAADEQIPDEHLKLEAAARTRITAARDALLRLVGATLPATSEEE